MNIPLPSDVSHWFHQIYTAHRLTKRHEKVIIGSCNCLVPYSLQTITRGIDNSINIRVTSQWAPLCIKSPASWLFAQPFIQGADQRKYQRVRVTGLCAGNSPVTGEFRAQRASNAEKASIWWRHHAPIIFCSCWCLWQFDPVPRTLIHRLPSVTQVRSI